VFFEMACEVGVAFESLVTSIVRAEKAGTGPRSIENFGSIETKNIKVSPP
jgi:hypothetical protein